MKELYENTWTEEDNGVRIFLLAGSERALVIDTGMTGMDVRKLVSAHTDLPLLLLNTHADMDHIAGNGQFKEFFMHPSEAFFYRHIQHGGGKMHAVYEGDRMDLGGRILQVVHLPGHTPGSITLLDIDKRYLIGGDPIQEDGDIFMFGMHRDMEAYISALRRLDARDDFDCIYPSHAKERVDRAVIPKLIQGAEDILNGRSEGTEKEFHGNRIMSYSAGTASFLCDCR